MDECKTGSEFEADIERNICSILGLPFDVLDMDDVVAQVHSAVISKRPCFITTPNLNILIACQTDSTFRQSVINSNLSLADGMPLIWMAKLLGIPFKERLAGSGLIEELIHSKRMGDNQIKVFFFGGDDGVADLACGKLSSKSGGVRCVGSINPGFGSIEEMSDPGLIAQINKSGAEFVIVSLGARKGQAWIERNRHILDAPLVSHLGAVVNFVAGTVDRAPAVWQRFGLEWLWRIKEEPVLWKRYFSDGLSFLKLYITRIIPYATIIRRNQKHVSSATPFSAVIDTSDGKSFLDIEGVVTSEHQQQLREIFRMLIKEDKRICIRLGDTAYVDPFFCGLVLVLYKYVGDRLSLMTDSVMLKKVLMFNGVDFLLE